MSEQTFSWDSATLPVPASTSAVMAQQWTELGQPGTWWTGEQRIAIAEAARAAKRELPTPDSSAITKTAQEAAVQVGAAASDPVSYTHLTLPTIYSV